MPPPSDNRLDAAYGLIERLLGKRSTSFDLLLEPWEPDRFEVNARSSNVEVRGSSAIAVCRGVYTYLKKACQLQVAWGTSTVVLPDRLPDYYCEGACPFQARLYLSVCTFGYSAPWWDWARWEQEIDWMALHGITMPLALAGQELIWQRVLAGYGIPSEETGDYFTGPAYLPWHRLGNLSGHIGPLPQHFIDSQADLQRKILDRQRALGMTPVVPGFSGFVPSRLRETCPDIELLSAEPWAGFAPTYYVDPRQPLFQELGARFLREYQNEFGIAHHYLCETYAEQKPMTEDACELRQFGAAIWHTLVGHDPDAVWVMQGWPFYFARDYWTPERADALLDAVPEGRMLVVDQATESMEVWRQQPVLRRKGWIHGVVHNYGGATQLHGDLQGFVDRYWKARHDPDRGRLLGFGLSPEGIDQNPVVYELLTDSMWSDAKIELSCWISDYLRSRYGKASISAREAWRLLLESVYGPETSCSLGFSWLYRPGDQPLQPSLNMTKVGKAAKLIVDAASEIGVNDDLARDIVDITKTWLGGIADAKLGTDAFFDVMGDMDELLSMCPEYCLGCWLEDARLAGGSEKSFFERNARRLVTLWGGRYLFDYAIKEWSGLVSGFISPRWMMYMQEPDSDLVEWEEKWVNRSGDHERRSSAWSLPFIEEVLAKYRDIESEEAPLLSNVAEGGPFSAGRRMEIDLGEVRPIAGITVTPAFGQGCTARYEIAVSPDQIYWQTLPVPRFQSDVTVKGTRRILSDIPVRYVQVLVTLDDGYPSQQFKAVVWAKQTSR